MSVTEEEKINIAKRVGPTCTVICVGLAKLYLASPNKDGSAADDPILATFPRLTEREWTYTHILGFTLLLTDHNQDAMFMRIYDFKRLQRRFEYEVYVDMELKMLDPQFFAFEIENCMAGLSFSVKSDALTFLQKFNALRPTRHDSAATILRKMRSNTLAKGEFGPNSGQQTATEEKAPEEPAAPSFVNCTSDQVKMLMDYQAAKKKYEADLAKYKAEQEALAKYESEKRKYEEKFRAYLKANEWGSEASTGSEASSMTSGTTRS